METDFSIVFTTFLLLMSEIKASKKKHHIVKWPVVLSYWPTAQMEMLRASASGSLLHPSDCDWYFCYFDSVGI